MGSPFRRQRSLRLDLDQIGPSKIDQNLSAPKPGILQFPDDSNQYDFTAASLEQGDCIGFGTFGGVVNRMVHKQTGREMAVKRIRAHEVVKDVRDKALSELRMIIQSQGCEDIVRFYGALFQNGDCWICMELMDCSLEKMYPLVFACGEHLPQRVVGFVTAAVVRALNYLKQVLNIIHRDVKPSNILLDKRGSVKLCDFGISGYLVNSIAETQDVGCQFYMAPERLTDGKRYDIRSDVWSLGISLVLFCLFANFEIIFVL
ncbi:Dual specificity mitogen-activated protein kinase kinase 4, variant 2 [Globodera pallida]|nr:Dual specificity mitogen-activated protein kinase kinase 4, variant 2 [Globodera pallida]